MGVPVYSVKDFESVIRKSVKRNWTMVIMANANSDSRAVEFIHANFHIMDRIANGVNFYLPGYGFGLETRYNFLLNESIFQSRAEWWFSDSHVSRISTKVIQSPRLGTIYFSEMEFADFVMEFTKKIPGYEYLGSCQMILLPLNFHHTPIYNSSKIYDLDVIVNSPSGLSLDAFIHHTFKIIRDSRTLSFLDRFLFHKRRSVIKKVTRLYREATCVEVNEDNYKIIVNNVIIDMEKCLH